jgi:chemotaxis protein CheC
MSDTIKLNEKQEDALKEIGTIGAGHAAMALSQMIGQKVNIAVVRVEIVPSDEFNQIVGGPETLGAVIYIQMLGDFKGGIFLFFKRTQALHLIDILLHKKKGETVMLSEMGMSALKEAGNILSGSYLSSMSQMVPFKIALSVPRFAFDMIGYVVEGIFREIMQTENKCLSLVTEFIESTNQIKGYFVFLPKKETMERILKEIDV